MEKCRWCDEMNQGAPSKVHKQASAENQWCDRIHREQKVSARWPRSIEPRLNKVEGDKSWRRNSPSLKFSRQQPQTPRVQADNSGAGIKQDDGVPVDTTKELDRHAVRKKKRDADIKDVALARAKAGSFGATGTGYSARLQKKSRFYL